MKLERTYSCNASTKDGVTEEKEKYTIYDNDGTVIIATEDEDEFMARLYEISHEGNSEEEDETGCFGDCSNDGHCRECKCGNREHECGNAGDDEDDEALIGTVKVIEINLNIYEKIAMAALGCAGIVLLIRKLAGRR